MRILENTEWVEQNFGKCELGNTSRTKRLQKMAINMLQCPDKSLPTQNTNWSDLKAAYELFAREECTLDSVAGCHWENTRATEIKHCLLICDTTDINHYTHKATTGLGMLGDGKGRGMQLHSCLMLDSASKAVIGIAGAKTYYRKRVRAGETRAERLKRSRESELWGDLVQAVGAPPEGSRWVYVFDRGGDNFEALCHIIEKDADWVVRVGKLNRKVLNSSGEEMPLGEAIKDSKELGQYTLCLRTRPQSEARDVKLRISITTVSLRQPQRKSPFIKDCGHTSIKSNVLILEEIDPPTGQKPISWILLTSLPIDTFELSWIVIEHYESRWTIEEYHKVIKTGCNIEGHSLRSAKKLEALIGLVSVVGVRLLSLRSEARNAPNTPVRNRIPPNWIKALIGLKPKLKKSQLTIYGFFRAVANLGGFIGRKSDGEPGWQTIWRGFHKLMNVVTGLEIAYR